MRYFVFLGGGYTLININCSANCKYQTDGKCNLTQVQIQKVLGNSDCIYFVPNNFVKK